MRTQLPRGTKVKRYGEDRLILAGFVDCHVHYPQTQIIGAYGEQLTDWLARYTYAAEQQFADGAHARAVAKLFLQECLRAGTTTAAVYCTVHPQSVDAFFEAASALDLRMIAGKVLMDRNAPAALTDTPKRGYDESKALIGRWHGKGRQLYCVTPRFAPTSSPEQIEATGALWREHPGTYLQSHVAESRAEIAWVKRLYPERKGYLDIYDHYRLLGPRAIYGHGIRLDRGRSAPLPRHRHRARPLPDVEPIPRQRPVRPVRRGEPGARCGSASAPISAAAHFFDAADARTRPTRWRS